MLDGSVGFFIFFFFFLTPIKVTHCVGAILPEVVMLVCLQNQVVSELHLTPCVLLKLPGFPPRTSSVVASR